jgi:signal transduction histidine kinase
MNLIYFAHNGVEHGTAAGATTHQSSNNTFLWVLAATAVAAAVVFVIVRLLNKTGQRLQPQEQDAEEE